MNGSSEQKYLPSVCDSCGEEFGCGAKLDGCWCSDMKLESGAADSFKNKFDGCLCPQCLATFAEQPAADPALADELLQSS